MTDEQRTKAIAYFKNRSQTALMPGANAMFRLAAEALNAGRWIPVSERLPEEHDSIFAKRYHEGTQLSGMFRAVSGEVIISGTYDDGSKFVTHSKTHDGAWDVSRIIPMTVTHWMPLPQPPRMDGEE